MGTWSGFGHGCGFIGMPWGIIFMAVLLVTVWLIVRKSNRPVQAVAGNDSASTILRERFARGEIGSEEYESMKKNLEG